MKVVAFCGYSGAGKTTLMERLIPRFKAAGQRVSVIKHAHHGFDIDRPGKDSWRHREAGAFEVLIASDRRLALLREAEHESEPDVHALIAELSDCDWVFVEGFRRADLPKIEVWRAAAGKPLIYPDDPHVVAVCTDGGGPLPVATGLPLLDLDQADAVGRFLLGEPQRYDYLIRSVKPPEPDVAGGRAGPPAGRSAALAGD
jgi:molybdopterin-guanine dinucleotide biosynthesis protein B